MRRFGNKIGTEEVGKSLCAPMLSPCRVPGLEMCILVPCGLLMWGRNGQGGQMNLGDARKQPAAKRVHPYGGNWDGDGGTEDGDGPHGRRHPMPWSRLRGRLQELIHHCLESLTKASSAC